VIIGHEKNKLQECLFNSICTIRCLKPGKYGLRYLFLDAMKNIILFLFIVPIIAFSQVSIIDSEEQRIFDEYGLTLEQYTELTNKIDSAILELISREVKYIPANKIELIKIEVQKILAADFAQMTLIQVQKLLAQATINKTDIEIARIYSSSLIGASTIQIPKLVAAIMAQGTDIQIASALAAAVVNGDNIQVQAIMQAILADKVSIEKIKEIITSATVQSSSIQVTPVMEALFADATTIQISEILSASLLSSSNIQIQNTFAAMFATQTEVQIKKVLAATYASKTGISILDYLDRTGFHWLIMRMKAAKAAGNEDLYQELQKQLIKSVNEWMGADGSEPILQDPEIR